MHLGNNSGPSTKTPRGVVTLTKPVAKGVREKGASTRISWKPEGVGSEDVPTCTVPKPWADRRFGKMNKGSVKACTLSKPWADRNIKWSSELGLLQSVNSQDSSLNSLSTPDKSAQCHLVRLTSYVDSGAARSVCPLDSE